MHTDINYAYKQTSGKLVLNDDTDVINQALTTLFNTPKGSRLFNRNYGSIKQSRPYRDWEIYYLS